jgi:hypothetical protein
MPEQGEQKPEYFEKYVNIRFRYLDRVVNKINADVDEIKADNKATRRWIFGTVVGTGVTVLFGLAALLLTFIQIQNSWMQQVISFVSKLIVK